MRQRTQVQALLPESERRIGFSVAPDTRCRGTVCARAAGPRGKGVRRSIHFGGARGVLPLGGRAGGLRSNRRVQLVLQFDRLSPLARASVDDATQLLADATMD